MKEIKLETKDLTAIKDLAHKNFVDKAIDTRDANNFLCNCYVQATIDYMAGKQYIVKNGKVYEEDTTS